MRPLLLSLLALLAAGCVAPQQDDTTRGPERDEADDAMPEECAPVAPETVAGGTDAGSSGSATNHPGSFTYSKQGVVTAAKYGYVWENPSATTRFSGSMQGTGSVKVQVFGPCGEPVLEKTLSGGSSSQTEKLPEARPGDYTVQLTFAAFSGTVSFTLTS